MNKELVKRTGNFITVVVAIGFITFMALCTPLIYNAIDQAAVNSWSYDIQRVEK